jgi:hypothetical protein
VWKKSSFRPRVVSTILAAAEICLAGTTLASAQAIDSLQGFEACKVITPDKARLDCLKKLLPKPSPDTPMAEESLAAWRLIRTPRPNGGPDAVAIMRTADTTESDPDLAGLMIRCREKPGFEVALALVRPFPPRSKRDVVIDAGTTQTVLHAETSPSGTALVLPIDATAFTTGPFRELGRLAIKIRDPESDVRGVIPVDGIGAAVAKLSTSCPVS